MTTAAVTVMVGLTTMATPAAQAQTEGWMDPGPWQPQLQEQHCGANKLLHSEGQLNHV